MITLKYIDVGIKELILNTIKNTSFKDVKFSSTSIEEEIIRPCLYITYPDNSISKLNKHIKSRVLRARLFYFAKNRKGSKAELMEMQDLIESLFIEDLNVKDIYFPVSEVDFDLDDQNGYLSADFELTLFEDVRVEETEEFAEDYEINMKEGF